MTASALGGPLVLGGGVAGSAIATLLSRAGRTVTLVEQHGEPRHKVCGEFLSAEACESLRAMGLDVRELGGLPVRDLRLASGARYVAHGLPFEAYSLTRRALDEAMLRMAEGSGVCVRRGERVEGLESVPGNDERRWAVRLSSGEELRAADVFLASGKHDLRGHARPTGPQGSLIAFKQYFHLREEQSTELRGAIELILFRGGYAGLQMVEGGCANLCLLVEARRYKELGGAWEVLLEAMERESKHLARRLRGAIAELERPLSLSRIPYGFVRSEGVAPGLWYLGDQAAVIPSFSGDGMSIALHTARVAAEVYVGGQQAQACTARLNAELRGLVERATALSRLMVDGVGQSVIEGAVRVMPGLLPRAAAWTRIPKKAQKRAG